MKTLFGIRTSRLVADVLDRPRGPRPRPVPLAAVALLCAACSPSDSTHYERLQEDGSSPGVRGERAAGALAAGASAVVLPAGTEADLAVASADASPGAVPIPPSGATSGRAERQGIVIPPEGAGESAVAVGQSVSAASVQARASADEVLALAASERVVATAADGQCPIEGHPDSPDGGVEQKPVPELAGPTPSPESSPVPNDRVPPPPAQAIAAGEAGDQLVAFLAGTLDDGGIEPSLAAASPPGPDAVHVDPASGNDRASGADGDPVRTLERALAVADERGEIVLREGVYREADIRLDGGDSPLIIRGHPGERVIVDSSSERYRDAPGDAWELVDAATGTYRSVARDHGRELWTGRATDASGNTVRLVSYYTHEGRGARGLSDLRSRDQEVSRKARYVGPGLFNDRGRLYLRLEPVDASAVHGTSLARLDGTDPNLLDLELTDRYAVFRVRRSNVTFQDLELRGALHGALVERGASSVRFERVRFSTNTVGVSIEDGARDVEVVDCDFHGDFPAHVAWSDMKGRDGQSKPASHWSLRVSGVRVENSSDVRVADSRFHSVFDGMVVLNSADVTVERNVGRFVDDMVQLGSDNARVEIRDNRVMGAGPSHYGQGDSPEPGTIYVHGNVIDSTPHILWGKHDPRGILRPAYSGWRSIKPFPAHDADRLRSGSPWKLYHNTVLFDATVGDPGYELWRDRNVTGEPHEVYNNIFINTGSGAFLSGAKVTADARHDGNLYWRVGPDDYLFRKIEGGSLQESFADLEAFRRSELFELSSGWESSGVEANPDLDPFYRPAGDGPVASAGVALPAAFPGPERPYRGARPPRGR